MHLNHKKKFSNKGLRLQSWDYGWNGKYFVTINTKDNVECFGDVISEEMYHSAEGKMANEYWEMIPEKFPFAKLDEFIVMPNHVHGIIEIYKSLKSSKSDNNRNAVNSWDISDSGDCGDAINRIPTDATVGTIGGFAGQKNPMLYDNLSRIIRWYKGRVSYEIHHAGYEFAWQTLFYDRIIRNAQEYYRIKQYIRNNPKNWKKKDK